MVNDVFDDVKAFHEKFGCETLAETKDIAVAEELAIFRHKFLLEEFQEYLKAYNAGDPVEMLDAFADIMYVIIGTALVHGMELEVAWMRVHASNMKKVRATCPADSKRSSVFDVVKPVGWKPPFLEDLV